MPVPYLQRIPKTIPVDTGRQRFVDDFLIEQPPLTRTFHTAEKFTGNPHSGSTLGGKLIVQAEKSKGSSF